MTAVQEQQPGEATARQVPEVGQLVRVRDRSWVVSEVVRSTQPPDVLSASSEESQHLVSLISVEDDGLGDELQVIWELEPVADVLDRAARPDPSAGEFDEPARLDAFLDAVRWGAITSADRNALQAPFRSGIDIEDYQLDPVVRALSMPRTNLLIADDVGLGKTIEAGLVVQELLLRHRARTVLVVCPASLCVKWRDEMAEKFGLDFVIVDSDLLRELRRTRGLYTNPFAHFPRLIVSIDWLKRGRAMRLIHDRIDGAPPYPRTFDLLIVDEIHTCAPAGTGHYAKPSLRTQAVRTIAPHFEHRLFLSATPHNGYLESFTAILELLDDQRFARGVRYDEEQLRRVMVRRLKSELPPKWDGTPRFPKRVIVDPPFVVDYSEHERRVHADLVAYGDLRKKRRAESDGQGAAADFVVTLLKKRLFSSPEAFAVTLGRHRETLQRGPRRSEQRPTERILRKAIDELEEDFGDEEAQDEALNAALDTAASFVDETTKDEVELLDRMTNWVEAARYRADTKVEVLLQWVESVVRPRDEWSDERVIIFTEYRDTQRWLHERLVDRGLAGEDGRRVELLYGGMDTERRERIKAEFQAAPGEAPVRILLATDAASEGIDLQLHCHRLVHYEIPWNPNRLEQRNGRVDRHGQTAREVLVHHFVGAGYEDAEPGSLEGDLQFLFTAAMKVDAIREDLGSVGPVIAEQVEQAMLGRRRELDTKAAETESPARKFLKFERDLRRDIDRLADSLIQSEANLRLVPDRVERVVNVALELAHQPTLTRGRLNRPPGDPSPSEPVFEMPPLTGSWARCTEGLEHPVNRRRRPITLDRLVAQGHDDVVHVHLGHRLVQQSLRLLRAEIWTHGPKARLSRATARTVGDDSLDTPAVVAYGRLVITGADGRRLHEELIAAGGTIREGRFARLKVGDVERLTTAVGGDMPSAAVRTRLAKTWGRIGEKAWDALDRRANDRARGLSTVLTDRADHEVESMTKVLTDLKTTIERELEEPSQRQLELFAPDERGQLQRDLDALKRRVAAIPGDIERESAVIRARYADPTARLFPVAVSFLVPHKFSVD